MLDRDLIRKQPEMVKNAIARKHLDAPIEAFLATDSQWRQVRTNLENLQAEMNGLSKSIGTFMAQGKKVEADEAKSKATLIKTQLPELEDQSRQLEAQLTEIELSFPNLPHESVPDGKDESENVVVREWGEKPKFDFEPKPHWELAELHQLLDLPRGAKVTGSGFPIYRGLGAKLQRNLGAFMVDFQVQNHDYEELYVPFLVNRESLVGTGNLPKFEDDLYKSTDDFYLIPTAEVPITNFYRDEILDGSQLPIRFAGLSSCFRREAGAAGKDTRGLLRIHQFDKVELVWLCIPENSYSNLETLTGHAEAILQALGLHYRVIELCAGDLGSKGSKCYDVEVWSPGVGRYLEISSCSNFEAYQSRRANIRFRREQGIKPEFVHILNGSGLATPRLFASLVESNQNADGRILIPEILRKYVGFDSI